MQTETNHTNALNDKTGTKHSKHMQDHKKLLINSAIVSRETLKQQ